MKLCPVFSVRPERLGVAPMHKNAEWHELLAKNNNGRHLMHIKGKDWAFEAPRDVSQSIPGVKFNEMARNRALQRCCGACGGVKAGVPDLALDMAKARVVDVESTKSQVVASTCPIQPQEPDGCHNLLCS